MDDISRQYLETLIPLFRSEPTILAAWLFGSRSKDSHTPDSDFDIFIVVSNRDHNLMQRIKKWTYENFPFPTDVILEEHTIWEERQLVPGLERTIQREGIMFYAA